MLPLPPHRARRPHLEPPVLRRRHPLRRAVGRPHGDVLPVVRVAADVEEPGGGDVLFEIVVVEVDAPPVGVAARARVDVVVVEVGRVAAV